MTVTDAKTWCKICRGYEKRKMPPDVLCENGIMFITEDEDNWIGNFYDPDKPPQLHPKATEFPYPLALVLKWDFDTVNVDRMKAIDKEYCAREGIVYDG